VVTDFITNPRKALRVPLRCVAHLAVGETQVEGHTEDVGARGCRVVTVLRIEPNTKVRLALDASGAAATLRVEARVVWSAANGAWHHGLSYDVSDRPSADGWFDAIAAARPELLFFDRVPDRVPIAARVYVATPQPGPVSDEEAAVLRLACAQVTVAELRERLGVDWSRAQRALFALLTRGVITLDPSEAGDPEGCRTHLGGSRSGPHRPN
jgi:PilZ domain